MRYISLLAVAFIGLSLNACAQKTPLPHGMVFGTKPDTAVVLQSNKLEAFMGKKNRISTVIKGRVIKVTNEQEGWFELDAGKGKLILARFKNYGIKLPAELKGRTVIVQGVANRKLKAINGKPEGNANTNAQNSVNTKSGTEVFIFEVAGLMVYK